MLYEKFSRRYGKRPRRGTYISITKSGGMIFTLDFYEKHLKGYRFLELYYSKTQETIGVKPVTEANEDAYEIRATGVGPESGRNPVYMISIKGFLKFYEIDYSQLKRFKPQWNETEKFWEIDLRKPF